MKKKIEGVILVLCLFVVGVMCVSAAPPSPPNITILPPTAYCAATNGGVEICDDIDNDCDDSVDEDDVCGEDSGSGGGGSGGGGSGGGGSGSGTVKTTNKTIVTVTDTKTGIIGGIADTTESSGSNSDDPDSVDSDSIVGSQVDSDESDTSEETKNSSIFGIPTMKAVGGLVILIILVIVIIFVVNLQKKKSSVATPENSANKKSPAQAGFPELKKIDSQNLQMQSNKNADKNNSNQNFHDLTSQEMVAMNYIIAMRQKGFQDDVIGVQLKSKGWKDEIVSKLLRK